jgi:hypothetical protein
MPEYRLYTPDDDGRLTGPPAIFDCPADVAGIAEAARYFRGAKIEIREGARLVSGVEGAEL